VHILVAGKAPNILAKSAYIKSAYFVSGKAPNILANSAYL
jgi:hypothetical protein